MLRRIRLRPVPKNCSFCKEDKQVDFRETEMLKRYVSERGKILSHQRTGVCTKHQRVIALAIKHARYLALLPYLNR